MTLRTRAASSASAQRRLFAVTIAVLRMSLQVFGCLSSSSSVRVTRDFVVEQIIREARLELRAWCSPSVLGVTSVLMPSFATTCPRASHILSRRYKISYARPASPNTPLAFRENIYHQHFRVRQFLSHVRVRKSSRFHLNRQQSSPCYAASTLAAEPQNADDGEHARVLASFLSRVM